MMITIKIIISIILGLAIGFLPNLVFALVATYNQPSQPTRKLYLAELCKILVFIAGLSSVLGLLKTFIYPTIFIGGTIGYIIVHFVKNLLKLRV